MLRVHTPQHDRAGLCKRLHCGRASPKSRRLTRAPQHKAYDGIGGGEVGVRADVGKQLPNRRPTETVPTTQITQRIKRLIR
ncbi:hypothetical protein GCM10009537_05990 [Corynebacterium riegelii]